MSGPQNPIAAGANVDLPQSSPTTEARLIPSIRFCAPSPRATRVVALQGFGGVEGFEDAAIETQEPGPHEVRIRVHASSFNAIDCAWRRGELSSALPAVLGRDFAGTIEAVGSAIDASRVGEAVMGYTASTTRTGAHAETICIDHRLIGPKPRSTDFAVAAALPVAGLTALECVEERANLRAGETVLVTGGRGGVGTMIIRMARRMGARVAAAASTKAAEDYLQSILDPSGDVVVRIDPEMDDESRLARLRQVLGASGVPVAIDAAGGAMKRLCLAAAAVGGRVVSIVEEPPEFDNVWDERTSPILLKGLSFHFVQIGALASLASPSARIAYARRLSRLAKLIDSGTLLPPTVTNLGPLSAATVRLAHERLEARGVFGKLVMQHEPSTPRLDSAR